MNTELTYERTRCFATLNPHKRVLVLVLPGNEKAVKARFADLPNVDVMVAKQPRQLLGSFRRMWGDS